MTGNEILWLGLPGSTDPALAGAKAARLAELVAAGFAVPEGFVVTTETFDRYAADDGPLRDSLRSTLATAAAALGDQPLAVRSSSSAEDLDDASFAGMYETVLGVRGAEALAQAVRRCWASAAAERVRSYHGGPQSEDPAPGRRRRLPSMAVLVQRLVQADAAGVAFTAIPVTGDRGETLVSAVRGLGDRLVSGEASRDEWTVRDDRVSCRRRVEGAIATDQARAVAALARRVEQHLGYPQDVEWALAGDEIHLLQAGPITALPDERIAVAVDVPEGFWEREASHYPDPVSPFMRAVELPTQNAAFRRAFAEFGILLEGLEFREIGGWMYQRPFPSAARRARRPRGGCLRSSRGSCPSCAAASWCAALRCARTERARTSNAGSPSGGPSS